MYACIHSFQIADKQIKIWESYKCNPLTAPRSTKHQALQTFRLHSALLDSG